MGENKTLTYIAAHSTSDKESPIHQAIKQAFQQENPDLYIMQGFSSDVEGISPERLKNKSSKICAFSKGCAHNLFGAYLATEKDIPFVGGEPSQDIYIPFLEEKGFTFNDVVFFMVCQQIPFFHRDVDFDKNKIPFTAENFDRFVTDFIQKEISIWLKQDIQLTAKDFTKWWKEKFQKAYQFERDLRHPEGFIITEPLNAENALITQKISWHVLQLKKDYMVQKIKQFLPYYDRILVVYGAFYFD